MIDDFVLFSVPQRIIAALCGTLIGYERKNRCHDTVSLDGKVHDPNRIDYLNRYLLKLAEAIDEGADVRGYFVWSLMDNFEWADGYDQRFGIVYIDYKTQTRIIKDSAEWYSEVIKTNGKSLSASAVRTRYQEEPPLIAKET